MKETRYVTEHKSIHPERELLTVITVFEPGASRQAVKKDNHFSKRWGVLAAADNGKVDWVKSID